MIKIVIFDWFGVCTKENWRDCIARDFKEKFNLDENTVKLEFKKLLQPFARDEITSEDFLDKFIFSLNISKNPKDFEYIFNEIPEINFEILNYIAQLKKNYKTYLLSNNFKPVFPNYQKQIDFSTYFDDTLLSHKIKISKTDERVWDFVIKTLKCEPNQVLFIDNTQKYLDVAKKLGINIILYKSNAQIKNDIEEFIETEQKIKK